MTTITCPRCNQQFNADVVEWIDAHLAATEIGLQTRAITYACKRGLIDGAQKHGNAWKFTRHEWNAYLERRTWIASANAAQASRLARGDIDAACERGDIAGARLYGKKWKFSRAAWHTYLDQFDHKI